MKEKLLSIASAITSFLAAICWMGMVLFTSLGLSGFGFAVVSRISPYRNLFIVLTIIMLGLAHYFIARNSNVSKNTRTIVWIMTIVSVGLIIYPGLFRR